MDQPDDTRNNFGATQQKSRHSPDGSAINLLQSTQAKRGVGWGGVGWGGGESEADLIKHSRLVQLAS